MDIQAGNIPFPPHKGSGPWQNHARVGFTAPVARAYAVMTGYSASFVNGDHKFGQLTVQLTGTQIVNTPDGPEVVVSAALGLRDFSENWDDEYQGQVDFCVIVEYERPGRPIHGLENL